MGAVFQKFEFRAFLKIRAKALLKVNTHLARAQHAEQESVIDFCLQAIIVQLWV